MRPHHVILSLETLASTFYGDALFPFTDSLNTLMGGSGTGKTTLLALVRYALGCPIPAAYAKEFDAHIRDVLGPGTAIARVVTQHGVEYAFSRAYGEPVKVRNAAKQEVEGVSFGDLFAIDFYGVKQIEQIAVRPDEQLALLDRFAPVEMRAFAHALEDLERKIAQSGAEVDRLTAAIEADQAREAELPLVVEALSGLALGNPTSGDALTRAEARRPARGREQNAMKSLVERVEKVRGAVDVFAREGHRLLVDGVEAELERAQEPIGDVFRRAHAGVHQAAGGVETLAGRLRNDLVRIADALGAEARALASIHDAEDESYKALVVRQDSDKGRAVERERLHRRRDELSALAKQMDERRRELGLKNAEHAAQLKARWAIVAERHALRDRLAKEITEAVRGVVRIAVKRGGLVTRYQELLDDVFDRSGVSKDLILQIATSIPPADLCALALREDEAPIVAVDTSKSSRSTRAQKVIKVLRASGRLREIETAPVEDLPLLELKVDGDYVESARLSQGQRCTAVLPILLLPSVNPLAIDQVEDHLDNTFTFQVLVQALLASKGSRQFIFASHNPNIPVLAEAERVFELAAKDKRGFIAAFGDVDEMRERIERVLEGGREAFLRRGERYGHLPPRGRK